MLFCLPPNTNRRNKVCAYDNFSTELSIEGGAYQGSASSPFSLNFTIKMAMEVARSSHKNSRTDRRLSDLEYAYGDVPLGGDPRKL